MLALQALGLKLEN